MKTEMEIKVTLEDIGEMVSKKLENLAEEAGVTCTVKAVRMDGNVVLVKFELSKRRVSSGKGY